MNIKDLVPIWAFAFALTPAFGALADSHTPEIKEWTETTTNDKGEKDTVDFMTIDGIMVHETDPAKQPQPTVVQPVTESTARKTGKAPSDAIVLFDGSDLSNWTSTQAGKPIKWEIKNGAMWPTRNSGMAQSKQEFGSCQLHIEFATPKRPSGQGQGRGNSGVFLMGQYEIQILDSYGNTTYPDGQAGALYGRSKPLVNASRKPGEWQTYDIIFHRPIFENGKIVKQATFTVLHNGVLIQDNYELSGGTGWRGSHSVTNYVSHGDKGPIQLQDHGNPVLFRNIWIRELKD
jgi:phenylpyruvate tautomerase PptA (4-oxalocrotonate tautomerase family)